MKQLFYFRMWPVFPKLFNFGELLLEKLNKTSQILNLTLNLIFHVLLMNAHEAHVVPGLVIGNHWLPGKIWEAVKMRSRQNEIFKAA